MYLYQQDRRHVCPQCGSTLRRVPRREPDRVGHFASAMRRYQCVVEACAWEGLLPRQRSTGSTRSSAGAAPGAAAAAGGLARRGWPAAARLLRKAWPLLAASAAAAGITLLAVHEGSFWQHGQAAHGPAPQPLAPGEHHEGVALSPQHPLAKPEQGPMPAPGVERLALRQGCAWGKPGTNPYRGTVDQALLTAKLPPEVVQRIAHKVQAGQPDDRLAITNAGIRTGRDDREFEPRNVAMTYGHTLCVNTRVNFPAGHQEQASLYEAADKSGNLYSVMVPDVCGNVSVLGARMERNRKRVPLAALAQTPHAAPPLLRLLSGDAGDIARPVPEPGTLACALAALAALGAARWHARRRLRVARRNG